MHGAHQCPLSDHGADPGSAGLRVRRRLLYLARDVYKRQAKHYEDDKVVSFINGILGSFVRAECAEPEVRNVEVQPETEAQK